MKSTTRKDSIIAGLVTFICVLVILMWLWFTTLRYDEKLASASNPELEEEELFLDPELLEQNRSVGNPETSVNDTPAPEIKGEPQPSVTEQAHSVNTGENETPMPEQQLVTSKMESAVENASSDKKKEEEKVASSMSGKFKMNPGSVAGKFDTQSGSEGSGSGVTGLLSGRQFLGCPLPDVDLSHKTTVTVSIMVDSEGNVTSAVASGPTTHAILKKCEQAAMRAKWSAKKGATSTRGVLKFIIIPK